MSKKWIEVTDGLEMRDGGERHVLSLSSNVWISVCHRLTGFGYMEWETAICRREPRTCNIVKGDHRHELTDKTEQELDAWYLYHCGETNSFETLMAEIKQTA